MSSTCRTLGFLLLLFAPVCKAQNYADYYQLINRAEEQFVLHRDSSCYAAYDSAFVQFTPFLKDPYIASQIAWSLGDTTRFYSFLQICFENGMPLTSVNASPMLRTANTGTTKTRIAEIYSKSFAEKSVDPKVYDTLCLMCYQSDSIKVRNPSSSEFDVSEERTRMYILDNFLTHGVFPNELLLGISSFQRQQDFYEKFNRPNVYAGSSAENSLEELELRLKCPYNIILHSKCFYLENKYLFFQAVLNGYLHPKELGILEERSILYFASNRNTLETCAPPEVAIKYNIYGYSPMLQVQLYSNTEKGLLQVERNRKEIYMQKYSVDLRKKELEKALGFKFFFDFADR